MSLYYSIAKSWTCDPKESWYFYRLAADMNHTESQYIVGRWMNMDSHEAFAYLLDAANSGHYDSMYCVAFCFDIGYGVTQSMRDANHWYNKWYSQPNRKGI